jgi:hypothetical protein
MDNKTDVVICEAIRKSGDRCNYSAKYVCKGKHLCGTHIKVYGFSHIRISNPSYVKE